MKWTLFLSLMVIACATLVVLVLGPEEGWVARLKTVDTDVRSEKIVSGGNGQVVAGLRPADSEAPADGVCTVSPDRIVTVAVTEDVPSPRCVKVSVGQKIRVENRTMERIEISFVGTTEETASAVHAIIPGDTALIDVPVEAYLSEGVHHFDASGYASAEIWFDVPREVTP